VSKLLYVFIGGLIVADIMLSASGNRILLDERIVRPGEEVWVGEWGNVGDAGQASLVCRYWTGRSIKPMVYWYGSGGKDQCPFIINPDK